MKDPKPHTRTPQIWGRYLGSHLASIRMLYPNGRTCWDTVSNGFYAWQDTPQYIVTPCWHGGRIIIKSFKTRIKLMKEYDKSMGCETVFLGNV